VSKLLINEAPLQVLPSLAVAIGLNEAIVVQQVHYWLGIDGVGVEKNGHKWVYNTIQGWQKQFPFWSADTVKRTLANLKKSGLLIGECLSSNAFDKTMYYRIDYDVLASLDDGNLPSSDGGNLPPSAEAKPHRPLYRTETTTETTQRKAAARPSLPEWLDPELWDEWEQHRREKKRPMTPTSALKSIEKLAAFRAKGITPKSVIDHSIANGYQGLFSPTSDPTNVSSKRPKSLNDMDYSADLF
jgi:hypothetical protein